MGFGINNLISSAAQHRHLTQQGNLENDDPATDSLKASWESVFSMLAQNNTKILKPLLKDFAEKDLNQIFTNHPELKRVQKLVEKCFYQVKTNEHLQKAPFASLEEIRVQQIPLAIPDEQMPSLELSGDVTEEPVDLSEIDLPSEAPKTQPKTSTKISANEFKLQIDKLQSSADQIRTMIKEKGGINKLTLADKKLLLDRLVHFRALKLEGDKTENAELIKKQQEIEEALFTQLKSLWALSTKEIQDTYGITPEKMEAMSKEGSDKVAELLFRLKIKMLISPVSNDTRIKIQNQLRLIATMATNLKDKASKDVWIKALSDVQYDAERAFARLGII